MTWPCKPRIGRRHPPLYAQVLHLYGRNNACRGERERRCARLCARAARTQSVWIHTGAGWRGANVRGLTGWQADSEPDPDHPTPHCQSALQSPVTLSLSLSSLVLPSCDPFRCHAPSVILHRPHWFVPLTKVVRRRRNQGWCYAVMTRKNNVSYICDCVFATAYWIIYFC